MPKLLFRMPRLINKPLAQQDVVECFARRCAKSAINEWYTEAIAIVWTGCSVHSEVVDAETYPVRKAEKAAMYALRQWYHQAFRNVENKIVTVQRDENLLLLKQIPDWRERKYKKDGYIMMVTPHNWEPRPIILKLDYKTAIGPGVGRPN